MDPVPNRERNVSIAKLAEKANRYEDVIDQMKEVVLMNVELTTEERNLMSSAYHKVIASRRCSWETLVLNEIAQTVKGEMEFVPKIKELVETVAGEINGFCTEVVSLLTRHVLPHCTSPEHRVVYYTMMGNCYAFLAELKLKDDDMIQREELIQEAITAYDKGVNIAKENLHAADPIRLNLAWNFSVFLYEMLDSVNNALEVAKLAVLETTKEVMLDIFSKETINCLECLKERITKWESIARGEVKVDIGGDKAAAWSINIPGIDGNFHQLIKEVVHEIRVFDKDGGEAANVELVNVATTLEGLELVD